MDPIIGFSFVCLLLLIYCVTLSRRISRIPSPTLFQRLDDGHAAGSQALSFPLPVDPNGSEDCNGMPVN